MMRSAARRDEVANYTLEVIIHGEQKPALPTLRHDAVVAGTDFHATSMIPCSLKAQPASSCNVGVKREGEGNGMVFVTKTDGRQRVIFFEKGRAIGYDQSQADTGSFKADRKGDTTIIFIDDERYEIPDALVLGG